MSDQRSGLLASPATRDALGSSGATSFRKTGDLDAVNGQVEVAAGDQLKVPAPRVDQLGWRGGPPPARACFIR
jgi:hypothetical protein